MSELHSDFVPYIQCGFMCTAVYIYLPPQIVVRAHELGEKNTGRVEIKGDVLDIPVINSRQRKSKLVRQQIGSFSLNSVCQRPHPRKLRMAG